MILFRRHASIPAPAIRLVAGLGNIGKPYDNTRHNIGFEVVDLLAHRYHAQFRRGRFKADEAVATIDQQRIILIKPTTLMNLSGDAVAALSRYYKIAPVHLLVICDDVNLPLGKLRLRAQGTDGGHNGLWHIINRVGTQGFPRLRIGVGEKPPQMDMVDFVLGHFLGSERAIINAARENAADAVETWISEGIEAAMNQWNGKAVS